jgi:hypothetical protein
MSEEVLLQEFIIFSHDKDDNEIIDFFDKSLMAY